MFYTYCTEHITIDFHRDVRSKTGTVVPKYLLYTLVFRNIREETKWKSFLRMDSPEKGWWWEGKGIGKTQHKIYRHFTFSFLFRFLTNRHFIIFFPLIVFCVFIYFFLFSNPISFEVYFFVLIQEIGKQSMIRPKHSSTIVKKKSQPKIKQEFKKNSYIK